MDNRPIVSVKAISPWPPYLEYIDSRETVIACSLPAVDKGDGLLSFETQIIDGCRSVRLVTVTMAGDATLPTIQIFPVH